MGARKESMLLRNERKDVHVRVKALFLRLIFTGPGFKCVSYISDYAFSLFRAYFHFILSLLNKFA